MRYALTLPFALVLAFGLASACSGDKPPDPDANPNGPLCTGQLYDSCVTEHECMSGLCHVFSAEGIQVCTTMCTVGTDTPCIVTGGQAGTCGATGVCTPPAANACHL